MTAILNRGLRNFIFSVHLFSLFHLDFYFFFFNFFLSYRGHILDFFQIFLTFEHNQSINQSMQCYIIFGRKKLYIRARKFCEKHVVSLTLSIRKGSKFQGVLQDTILSIVNNYLPFSTIMKTDDIKCRAYIGINT